MKSVGLPNCAVSIMTIFELSFGAENSDNPQKHHKQTEMIRDNFQVIPLDYDTAQTFAQEKARLHEFSLRVRRRAKTRFDIPS